MKYTYKKINWVNDSTPLNADNLNRMEAGISDALINTQSLAETAEYHSKEIQTLKKTLGDDFYNGDGTQNEDASSVSKRFENNENDISKLKNIVGESNYSNNGKLKVEPKQTLHEQVQQLKTDLSDLESDTLGGDEDSLLGRVGNLETKTGINQTSAMESDSYPIDADGGYNLQNQVDKLYNGLKTSQLTDICGKLNIEVTTPMNDVSLDATEFYNHSYVNGSPNDNKELAVLGVAYEGTQSIISDVVIKEGQNLNIKDEYLFKDKTSEPEWESTWRHFLNAINLGDATPKIIYPERFIPDCDLEDEESFKVTKDVPVSISEDCGAYAAILHNPNGATDYNTWYIESQDESKDGSSKWVLLKHSKDYYLVPLYVAKNPASGATFSPAIVSFRKNILYIENKIDTNLTASYNKRGVYVHHGTITSMGLQKIKFPIGTRLIGIVSPISANITEGSPFKPKVTYYNFEPQVVVHDATDQNNPEALYLWDDADIEVTSAFTPTKDADGSIISTSLFVTSNLQLDIELTYLLDSRFANIIEHIPGVTNNSLALYELANTFNVTRNSLEASVNKLELKEKRCLLRSGTYWVLSDDSASCNKFTLCLSDNDLNYIYFNSIESRYIWDENFLYIYFIAGSDYGTDWSIGDILQLKGNIGQAPMLHNVTKDEGIYTASLVNLVGYTNN